MESAREKAALFGSSLEFRRSSRSGASLVVTDRIDDHSEMLSEWEAETRYNMDFIAEKRKLGRAVEELEISFRLNGIRKGRECSDFELNCYYLMFGKTAGRPGR